MRGGTLRPGRQQTQFLGLSPHARGNRVGVARMRATWGPIPACAGEPDGPCSCGRGSRAYPRMRGGTYDRPGLVAVWLGLSPHARGNLSSLSVFHLWFGPIPACAGEPRTHSNALSASRAYPRMRGGTQLSQDIAAPYRGLSPHARGNPSSDRIGSFRWGPIPACAGEPRCWGTRPCTAWAYPRMRGGTRPSAPTITVPPGLSPHARGNRKG